jgi:hypothetical protein
MDDKEQLDHYILELELERDYLKRKLAAAKTYLRINADYLPAHIADLNTTFIANVLNT